MSNIIDGKVPIPSNEFAKELGDALGRYLHEEGISQADASRRLEMERATMNTYLHDYKKKRRLANAEVFIKACVKLGFTFDYKGYRIMAVPSSAQQNGQSEVSSVPRQLTLEFDEQIYLTNGMLSISLKRPPGRVELNVSLKGKVS